MTHSLAPHRSDAFVFFGATGDLAYKQIFPALHALARRGELDMPVIGVARSGWNLDQLRARARDSLQQHGGVDEAAFAKLAGLLQYIDGDYSDPNTYERLRAALGSTQHPLHYLTDVAAIVADVALAAPRNGIVEIAGPERAPLNEIVARYLKAVGDPREVVSDPEARYYGGRVEECSLVPLGEARLGRIGLDEWLRRSQARA
jgi:Glucose-6-phosphate dehydrogenase, NAD binding domain